ncbi:MAG: hypothetical protein M5R36_16735 [Deltaproteobacteria bacterium]|nr:hypothetical protein [Deltaproteobacteria bacterium]
MKLRNNSWLWCAVAVTAACGAAMFGVFACGPACEDDDDDTDDDCFDPWSGDGAYDCGGDDDYWDDDTETDDEISDDDGNNSCFLGMEFAYECGWALTGDDSNDLSVSEAASECEAGNELAQCLAGCGLVSSICEEVDACVEASC